MTDLTDKWKKGKLPNGWYYVEGNRVEGIYAYTAEYLNNMYRPRNGERIIAKVPSYEELQNINKSVNDLMASNIKLIEENKHLKERLEKTQELELEVRRENTKLKELLKLNNILNKGAKAIYAWLKEDTAGEQKKLCAELFDKTVEMISEINQALGEE